MALRFHCGRWLGAALIFTAVTAWPLAAQEFSPFRPLPTQPPYPKDNPPDEAKAALGKQLFFDRRLSSSQTLSCNDCHNLLAGGEDGRAIPVGAEGRRGERSTPTLWNVGFYTVYNWYGSARSLEEQLRVHWLAPEAMAMPESSQVLGRLKKIPGYRRQFEQVFGREQGVSFHNAVKAVATFLRTLVTTDSPFDRFLQGDETAISAQARRGFDAFIEVGCAACHFWVNLAGPVPGLAFEMGEGFYELFPNYPGTEYEKTFRLAADQGRVNVTKLPSDTRMWRVPTLRNIGITAPYFHNGSVATLPEAVAVMAKTQLDKTLTDEQIEEIVAFLDSLTGRFPEITLPHLPQVENQPFTLDR